MGNNIIGKINLTKLFAEWKNETPDESYYEPRENWHLKKSEIYSNDCVVCLFESIENGKNYYRTIIGSFEDGKFKYFHKLRCCSGSNVFIDYGVTDDGVFFIENGADGTSVFAFAYEGEECIIPDLEDLYTCTDNKISVVIGNVLYFLFAPDVIKGRESKKAIETIMRAKIQYCEDYYDDDDDGDDDGDEDNSSDDKKDKDIGDISIEVAAKVQILKKPEKDEPSAAEKLEKLIGLSNTKAKIREIMAYACMQKRMKALGKKANNLCFNMVFTGNPGTAKTTVARLVAGILYEEGIIKTGKFMEVGRSDLVAVYIGQTAVKIKKVFKDIKGGVLFVDEAYSLCDGNYNGYGDEALATIVQEMENNRDTVVIFAGYPREMEELLNQNPGLRSRFPINLSFDDYSADELTAITEIEAERMGFSIEPDAMEKIEIICASAMKSRGFGNGRFCRVLAESAEMKHALSLCEKIDSVGESELFTLVSEDFEMPSNMKINKCKNNLGFCA